MKKIYLYFKDKEYEERLKKAFNLYKTSLLVKNIDDINQGQFDSLILTDYSLNNDYWHLGFYNDKSKYRSIEDIYKECLQEFELNKAKWSQAKLISFVNVYENIPSPVLLKNLAKGASPKGKSLIVDFTNFYLCSKNKKELSIDNLLFLDEEDKDFTSNEKEGYDYLLNSKIPLEIEKKENYEKILRILKNSNYSYIFMNLGLYLNQKNIDILNSSDILLFYYSQNQKTHFSDYSNILINYIDSEIQTIHLYKEKNTYKIMTPDLELKTIKFEEIIEAL